MVTQPVGRAAAGCGHAACVLPLSPKLHHDGGSHLQFAEAIIQQLHELADTATLGDSTGSQVALWLRLALLSPLLPLVYASKEGVAGGSLRARLAPILLR